MAEELMIFTYKDEKNKFFPLVIFNSKKSIENQEFVVFRGKKITICLTALLASPRITIIISYKIFTNK